MNDAEIVALYLARDESAISQTAERYGPRLQSLANGILEDAPAAEECVNDTYLTAWNSIPPNEPRDYLYAFLARITRHLSIDRCRAKNRERRKTDVLTAELSECVAAPERAEDRLNEKELAAAVSAFLCTLPETKRTLFLRRYWYCDSVSDIAHRFGWGESRVKTALHRIRAALREYLRKEGYLE